MTKTRLEYSFDLATDRHDFYLATSFLDMNEAIVRARREISQARKFVEGDREFGALLGAYLNRIEEALKWEE